MAPVGDGKGDDFGFSVVSGANMPASGQNVNIPKPAAQTGADQEEGKTGNAADDYKISIPVKT